jgi:hypothetical protein
MILTLARAVKALTEGGKDAEAFRHGMGWWSPEMKVHYRTLFLEPGRWHHDLMNIFTEWVRLDAQRAAKLGLDIIFTGVIIFIIAT